MYHPNIKNDTFFSLIVINTLSTKHKSHEMINYEKISTILSECYITYWLIQNSILIMPLLCFRKKLFNFFEQIHIIIVLVNIIQNKECSHCFLCLKWKKGKCIENLSKWLNFSSRSHCRRLNIIFYDNSFPLSAVEYFYDYCCILF